MDSRPPILLPYTVSNGAAAVLRSIITTKLPTVAVEHAATPTASRRAIETAPIVVAFGLPDELHAHAESLQWVQALNAVSTPTTVICCNPAEFRGAAMEQDRTVHGVDRAVGV